MPFVPEEEAAALSGALSVPRVVARLLWLRGLRAAPAAVEFLTPKLAQLVSPDELPDMGLATERVARAIGARERIAVCGDYDVDGMTGTALLVRFLTIAGADVVYAIPDRESDGYGLSPAGVERLAARGVRLAITVDNGVSAFDALTRAKELGIDVVVTDHHLPPATLPPAAAIVDPHRTDVPVRVPSLLCGCGLAFKLAWGVAERMQRTRRDDRLRGFLRDAVGLVALATVADVVPLSGENRVLVHAGLLALRATPHAGVRALLAGAGLGGTAPLSTDDVVWRLAPRLNAAGRLNRPDLAIDLLTTDDPANAARLAAELEAANESRREIEKGVVAAAVEQARERLLGVERRSLVVAGDGWHRGVIGIVAARLVDAHDRPTVVIGMEGDGGRGSCRTPRGVDLHAALSRCSAHLRRYGGHAAAAGLEIDRGSLPAFVEAFEEAVRLQSAGADAAAVAPEVDGEATPGDFDLACAEAIRRLAPFGHGNPEPRFLLRGAVVAGRPRLMGAGSDHLSFALKTPTGAVRVIAFRRARSFDLAASGVPLDLVVSPTVNEWRGVRSAELVCHDVGRSEGPS